MKTYLTKTTLFNATLFGFVICLVIAPVVTAALGVAFAGTVKLIDMAGSDE